MQSSVNRIFLLLVFFGRTMVWTVCDSSDQLPIQSTIMDRHGKVSIPLFEPFEVLSEVNREKLYFL